MREKTVFRSADEVCHIWAQQNHAKGRAGNVYFEGPTIYSYGSHFPMASFCKTKDGGIIVLVTNRRYSVTTSCHMGRARNAVSHHETICVRNPGTSLWAVEENVKDVLSDIETLAAKVRNARDPMHYVAQINAARSRIHNYMNLLSLKVPTELREKYRTLIVKDQFTKAELAVFGEKSKRFEAVQKIASGKREERRRIENAQWAERNKEAAKAREENAAKELEEQKTRIPRWLAGENVSLYRIEEIYLRVNGEEVETSAGARIPLTVAHKLWDRIKSRQELAGMNLGHYHVDQWDGETLTAGCHQIKLAEMTRLAGVLGWQTDESEPS